MQQKSSVCKPVSWKRNFFLNYKRLLITQYEYYNIFNQGSGYHNFRFDKSDEMMETI